MEDERSHTQNAFARVMRRMDIRRTPRASPQTDHEDARAFRDSLVTAYPVVLFCDGPLPDDANDPARILADMLDTIGLAPRLIDIKADITLSLAFDDATPVPQVYLTGRRIGGLAQMIDALKNGTVSRLATLHRLPCDDAALAALTKSL